MKMELYEPNNEEIETAAVNGKQVVEISS